MQMLRNLRLAARLGVAFGALALGLLVVSVVAFSATDGLTTQVDSLADDVPRYTATVDGIAIRVPEEAHLLAQHLYVHDGDLAAQDDVAAEFGKLAAADDAAFGDLIGTLEATQDGTSAADDARQLRRSHAAFIADARRALEASRQETVDRVEDRVESRTLYTDQILPAHRTLLTAVGENAKGAVAFAAAEGDEAHARDRGDEARDPRRRPAQRAGRDRPRGLHHPLGDPSGARAQQPARLARRQLPAEPVRRPPGLRRGRPHPAHRAGHDADASHVDRRDRPPVGHVQRHARQGPDLGRVLQRDAQPPGRHDRPGLDLRGHGLRGVAADGDDVRRGDARDRRDRLGGVRRRAGRRAAGPRRRVRPHVGHRGGPRRRRVGRERAADRRRRRRRAHDGRAGRRRRELRVGGDAPGRRGRRRRSRAPSRRCRRARSGSAGSWTRSPASPSRRTCWR